MLVHTLSLQGKQGATREARGNNSQKEYQCGITIIFSLIRTIHQMVLKNTSTEWYKGIFTLLLVLNTGGPGTGPDSDYIDKQQIQDTLLGFTGIATLLCQCTTYDWI